MMPYRPPVRTWGPTFTVDWFWTHFSAPGLESWARREKRKRNEGSAIRAGLRLVGALASASGSVNRELGVVPWFRFFRLRSFPALLSEAYA